jgi:hypothetical protein
VSWFFHDAKKQWGGEFRWKVDILVSCANIFV